MDLTEKRIFVPVDVKEELPTDENDKFVMTTHIDHEVCCFEDGKWEGDLRGDNEHPEKVTHWLKEENKVVLSSEELANLITAMALHVDPMYGHKHAAEFLKGLTLTKK